MTIVELTISTAIFSIVLLTITLGITSFSKRYYNSVTSSSTQGTVQNVINVINKIVSENQDNTYQWVSPTTSTPNTPGVFCMGDEQFIYFLGWEQTSEISGLSGANPTYPYALYEEPEPSGGCSSASNITYSSGGESLLGDNERLLAFNVQPISVSNIANSSDLYSINISVAYTAGGTNGNGDSLLCGPSLSPTGKGGCQTTSTANNITNAQLINYPATSNGYATSNNIICKPGQLEQYCAISSLQSSIESR
jgi:hypothetical protein